MQPAHFQEITTKRALVEEKGIIRESGCDYIRVCPACQKPNSLESQFCSGCTFGLVSWDEQKLTNVFLELVQGKDIGCNIRQRTSEIIIIDDKFPVSDAHLDCIPTQQIKDIQSLTKTDIPLLKQLFSSGLAHLESMKLSRFEGFKISDFVVAGFNHPVSIPHLHLHMVLPPFKHEKVFQYPRWHSYQKVLDDLEKHGKVLTFDTNGTIADWEPIYTKAIKDHNFFLSPLKQSQTLKKEKKMEINFKQWRKQNPSNRQLKWVSSDSKKHQIIFSIKTSNYTLSYPSSKDPESSFFFEGPDFWENDVNEWIFSEGQTSLGSVLDRILSCSGVDVSKDGGDQTGDILLVDDDESMGEDEANARQFGIGINWFYDPPNHFFCRKVIEEIKGARSLLGEGAIRTSGLGFLSLYVDITDCLDDNIAAALELRQEPCTIEFDFDIFWQLKETDRIPMPTVKCRQQVNDDSNIFGTSFHLKEIVLRYLDDNYKWSEKPLISMGTFDNNKGINQKHGGGKSTGQLAVDPIMVSQLQQLGFKKSAIEQALSQSRNRYEVAVDKLIQMGERAVEVEEPSGPSVNSRYKQEIMDMGFSEDKAIDALKKTGNHLEDAISHLLNQADDSFGSQEIQKQVEIEQKNILQRSNSDVAIGAPQLSRSETNLFVGLSAYLKTRLKHYMRFCMICHKRHACHNEKPVVCCNPLCIFRYTEMLPERKREKLKEVDRITICPFTDCDAIVRGDNNMNELMSLFGESAMEDGNNQEQMLGMQSHRYLPNKDVMDFINVGVKKSGQKIAKIENVLKPELVVAFEARWEELKRKRGFDLASPTISYHGTAEANINSILERGLLVPGKGTGKDVKHATDTGFWGGGIYLSPDSLLSIGYCRGGKKLLICSVLMGKRFTVTTRMDGQDCVEGFDSHVACGGQEWILFVPSSVLPCYLVSFQGPENQL